MRISDWSSDVCSSDLGIAEQGDVARIVELGYIAQIGCWCVRATQQIVRHVPTFVGFSERMTDGAHASCGLCLVHEIAPADTFLDRKSVGSGKSVSVRVDLGGCSLIQIKKIAKF